MSEQILEAFKKHYGEWNENGRDCNTFAAGWLEARSTERARCVAIVDQYIGDRRWYDPVKSTAIKIRRAVLNG